MLYFPLITRKAVVNIEKIYTLKVAVSHYKQIGPIKKKKNQMLQLPLITRKGLMKIDISYVAVSNHKQKGTIKKFI